MNKSIKDIDSLSTFSVSESPTIKLSEVCSLIGKMDDTLDLIANEEQYDGFNAALEMVKEFFLGGLEYNFENGSVIKTIHGKPVRGNRAKMVPYLDGFVQEDLLDEVLRKDEQEGDT
jgi:hypothetical protein